MSHWPYVQVVNDALTARAIPPGTVRAGHHGLERGLTITLASDVSRISGRGGIRIDWEERQGWYHAPTGLNAFDVLLYTAALRAPSADPERVADVPEELVRFRRLPEEYREECLQRFLAWRGGCRGAPELFCQLQNTDPTGLNDHYSPVLWRRLQRAWSNTQPTV
ncbi:hypothetical protein ABZT02_43285 [Streptomyces sp. NPDC005402]|uniref:hypothetical protein n=1 Tax=Streptomyces sp. NPDC005402 TaxID=3155338 RepID=UPI0033A6E167